MRRGVIANEQQSLVPGLFARVYVPIGQPQPRLLVESRAISTDQRGTYVLVVNAENEVEYRPIQVSLEVDDLRVVDEGLSPDDWVVVNGLQRARPGATVTPERAAG